MCSESIHFMAKLLLLEILLLFAIALPFSQASQDPSLHGALVFDIMTSATSDFELETALWKTSGLIGSSKYFIGVSLPYLGGKGTMINGGYYERVYTGLPSHSIVYYSLKFLVIDQWNPTDSFSVYMDDRLVVDKWNPGISVAGFLGQTYGDPTFDLGNLYAIGKTFHTKPTLTLKIVLNLDTSPFKGGLGFRIFNLIFAQKGENEVEVPGCAVLQTGSVQGVPLCGHAYNKYVDTNGIQQPCTSPCMLCFGPSSSQCYYIPPNYSFDGYQTISCYAGCARCFGPNINQCTLCSGSSWNYWDYTCQTSCASPGIDQGTLYKSCLAPCQAQGTFTLWDNTCSGTCDSPLVQRIEGKAKFCDFPCTGANDILFSDGTCTSSQSCESPAQLDIISGEQVCRHPCQTQSDFYYEKDGSCKSKCEYPYKVEDQSFVQVCKLDIEADDATQVEQISATISVGELIAKIAGMVQTFLNANNVGLLFMASMTQILQYIIFLKINYPPKLQLLIDEQKENMDKFTLINTPSPLEDAFPLNQLPEKFEDNVHSSFFINFWQTLIILSSILVILGFARLINRLPKRPKWLHIILNKIISSLQWNLPLGIICSSYGMIGLYTFVELKVIVIDSPVRGLSLLTNIIVNAVGILVLITILLFCNSYQVLKKRYTSKDSAKMSIDKFLANWKNYEVLFEGYRSNSILQHMFIFIFMLRIYLHYAIVALFNEYPFHQTLTLTIISALIIIYLALKRPMKSLFNFIQQIVCEIAILIVNICVTILAAMDKWSVGTSGQKEGLGNVIIGIQIALTAVLLLVLAIELVSFAREIWSFCKTRVKKPLQQESIDSTSKSVDQSNSSVNLRLSNSQSQMKIENSILDQSLEKTREKPPSLSNLRQDNYYLQKRMMSRYRKTEQEL